MTTGHGTEGFAHLRPNEGSLIFALQGRGDAKRLVHISEVPSGLKCNCVCPQCARPLVARRGRVREHHFAHLGDATCNGALETALHEFAKSLIADLGEFHLPELVVERSGQQRRVADGYAVVFGAARLESQLGAVVPDVIADVSSPTALVERSVLIEIFVTHAVDMAKLKKISDLGVPTIEVDLSRVRRDASKSDLTKAILDTAPRRWIYHPIVPVIEAEMEAAVEATRRETREAIGAEARKCVRWAHGEKQRHDDAIERTASIGISNLLVESLDFKCPLAIDNMSLQAIVILDLFSRFSEAHRYERLEQFKIDKTFYSRYFRFGDAYPYEIPYPLPPDVLAEARRLDPNFRSPTEAVRLLLRYLANRGFLFLQPDNQTYLAGAALRRCILASIDRTEP